MLAGVLLAAPSSTPDQGIELSWTVEGPPGCDAESFRGQVSTLLRETKERISEDLQVGVELASREDGSWKIALHIKEGDEETHREFEADRCETVVEAAALVVAMQIDPTLLDMSPPPIDTEPEPEQETGPEPESEPEPPPETPVVPRSKVGISIAINGGVTGLALPGVTGQLGGRVGVVDRGWSVSLGVRNRFETRAPASNDVGGGAFRLFAGQATGCGWFYGGPLAFPMCGVLEVGALTAEGYGIPEPKSSRRPWLALRAQPGLAYLPRPWIALGLALDVGLVASRERYFIEGVGAVHDVGPIELGALLSVEFRVLPGSK